MESKTFWTVVCLGGVLFFVLLLGFMLNDFAKERTQKPKSEYKIYHMKYGGVYCGEMTWNHCGVFLKKCTDDKEYYCMQDVSVEVVDK
jgi:hypothetical protein